MIGNSIFQWRPRALRHSEVMQAYAGCLDTRKSTTEYVFLVVVWLHHGASRRQKAAATATMDAEYMAAANAAKEVTWLRWFISDLRIPGMYIKKVTLCIDNNAAKFKLFVFFWIRIY